VQQGNANIVSKQCSKFRQKGGEEEMKRTTLVVAALFVIAVLACNVAFAQRPRAATRQIDVVKIMEEVKNPSPDSAFTIDLKADHDSYDIGDWVFFSFKSTKDCYLTLLHVAPSGRVTIIFPNQHQKDNKVKAGQVYRVPSENARFKFEATGPPGVYAIKAIATLQPVALYSQDEVTTTTRFWRFRGNVQKLKQDLEVRLKPVDSKTWTECQKEITVKGKLEE
jgi:preprotein translocase subunit SecG